MWAQHVRMYIKIYGRMMNLMTTGKHFASARLSCQATICTLFFFAFFFFLPIEQMYCGCI